MEEGTPPGATNALKRTFNEFDKDRSGKIDKGELKSALESLGKRGSDPAGGREPGRPDRLHRVCAARV
jgi:hypothetical protein